MSGDLREKNLQNIHENLRLTPLPKYDPRNGNMNHHGPPKNRALLFIGVKHGIGAEEKPLDP